MIHRSILIVQKIGVVYFTAVTHPSYLTFNLNTRLPLPGSPPITREKVNGPLARHTYHYVLVWSETLDTKKVLLNIDLTSLAALCQIHFWNHLQGDIFCLPIYIRKQLT